MYVNIYIYYACMYVQTYRFHYHYILSRADKPCDAETPLSPLSPERTI